MIEYLEKLSLIIVLPLSAMWLGISLFSASGIDWFGKKVDKRLCSCFSVIVYVIAQSYAMKALKSSLLSTKPLKVFDIGCDAGGILFILVLLGATFRTLGDDFAYNGDMVNFHDFDSAGRWLIRFGLTVIGIGLLVLFLFLVGAGA